MPLRTQWCLLRCHILVTSFLENHFFELIEKNIELQLAKEMSPRNNESFHCTQSSVRITIVYEHYEREMSFQGGGGICGVVLLVFRL